MNAHVTEDALIQSTGRSWLVTLYLVALLATAIVLPMCFLGNASGHDFQPHVASWIEAAGQWREGIFFPRWAAGANGGFGEPRFIFYPPASWMLGAAIGSPAAAMIACAIGWAGTRTATVLRPAVTTSGTTGCRGSTSVSGPGQNALASSVAAFVPGTRGRVIFCRESLSPRARLLPQ